MKLATLEMMMCQDPYELLVWMSKNKNLIIPSKKDFEFLQSCPEVQTFGIWLDSAGLVAIIKMKTHSKMSSYGLNPTSFPLTAKDVVSINSGFANLHGIISSLAPKVSLALLYRNYQRNYHSFFNQALAESTNAVNEKGFYAGLTLKFNRQWDLFVFSDFFRFPWLKFGVDGPSSGYELFTQISYSPSKLFKLIGRLRQQIKEENSEDLVMGLDLVDKRDFRIDLQYKISADFSLRNRVELVRYHKGELNPEYGFLSFQDIIFDPMGSKFSGNIRFGLFETSGFNSRIYAYEHDVLYAYSVPAYQGKGSRFYINGRYTLKRGFDLWLRYAAINYANQETLGSGTELINGSKRSEIRLQLRLQF